VDPSRNDVRRGGEEEEYAEEEEEEEYGRDGANAAALAASVRTRAAAWTFMVSIFFIEQERRTTLQFLFHAAGRGQVRALQVEDTLLQLGLHLLQKSCEK